MLCERLADVTDEAVRDWPGNPLRARNRHEAALFLKQQKAEVLSRSAIEGGEVIVGRTPELLFRFVFVLLEDDPEDENDFGSGVSQIFNPVELMLEVEGKRLAGSDAQGQSTFVASLFGIAA